MPQDQLRPITALFADITGSTGLGERLAPDEVKALIGECVTRMSGAVEDFGGTIQAYQGDGICAYFGVPIAHEDDPERAARAALKIVDLMAAYGREVEAAWGIAGLGVRVGVNSGQAGVGMVGAADPQTVALGDATNVAARLEAAAEPGTIAIGESTARRLAGRFITQPLGPLQVKGRGEPVTAWRLIGPQLSTAGPEAPAAAHPFVGRDEEVGRLTKTLDQLVAGQGQVVLMVGEAGIGKTRTLAQLRSLEDSRLTWLQGQCLSYGARSPFGPFVEMLRGWLGIPEGEPDLAVRTRLRARLGADRTDQLPELGRLLGIRVDADAENALAELSSSDLAARLRAAYVGWLRSLTARGPVAIAVEDVNWADESSADLATEVMALTDRAPVGLILTLRPEAGTTGWAMRTRALSEFSHRLTSVELGPLSQAATEELATELVPEGIDPATRRTLAEVSEGNPLFLEELLARLEETGALAHHEAWTLTVPRNVLPPAIEGLLVARIDHLPGDVRAVTEAAAVIGRRFNQAVLDRVVQGDVEPPLEVLLRAGIIVERGRYPEAAYEFRHGLLHEAVLGTLTDARRAELHLAIARAYEAQYPAALEGHLEELAHHYARAHDLRKALEYLERGAERAVGLGANDEAGRLWLRALRAANRLNDEAAADRIRERMTEATSAG